jgi:hypothetical protein
MVFRYVEVVQSIKTPQKYQSVRLWCTQALLGQGGLVFDVFRSTPLHHHQPRPTPPCLPALHGQIMSRSQSKPSFNFRLGQDRLRVLEQWRVGNRTALLRYPGALQGGYTVPDTVVSIGSGAFWQCSLVGVSMLSNLRVIENSAFSYAGNLASLSIGDGVTNIGYAAFFACSNLPSATIPASVLYIGDEAFRRCSSLSEFTVELANPNYCSEDGVLFNKNKTALMQMPPAKAITSYSIPQTVIEMRLYCFFDCDQLASITLPSKLTRIGEGAFGFCDGLTTMSMPHSVTNIGQAVWEQCTSLTNVILGAGITNLSGYTFAGSYNLGAVYFEGNAPAGATSMDFLGATNAIVYYLPGTTRWTTNLGGRPTALWNPLIQTGDGSFGVQANGFGFTVTGTTNIPIVVEASENLAGADWTALRSCAVTNGSIYINDPDWTNYPARLYRIRSP